MRVPHVKLFLAAVAIAHATKAKLTTSVAVTTTSFATESSSSAGRDKGNGMMNANVVVKEVLAEAKTTTFAATNPTKPSEESTYTANKDDDDERMFNLDKIASEVAGKLKNLAATRLKNVRVRGNSQLRNYDYFSGVGPKQPKAKAFAKLKKRFGQKRIAELIVVAKMEGTYKSAALKLEEAQMKYWLDKGLSAEKVFKLLGLTAENGLLTYPLFKYWYTYVERIKAANGNKEMIKF